MREIKITEAEALGRSIEEQLKLTRDECERLRKENARLRSLIKSDEEGVIHLYGSIYGSNLFLTAFVD